jgi:hypothetical protein
MMSSPAEGLSGWAAEQYGAIGELRAEAATAMAAGQHSRAEDLSQQALNLSRETVERLASQGAAAEILVPHEVLAITALGDLASARTAAGDLAGALEHLAAISRVLTQMDERPAMALARRRCPHGQPSYDGNCMSRPPCPRP